MNFTKSILPLVGAFAFAACGQQANGQSSDATAADTVVEKDFGAKSDTYLSEERHRYITFSYSHFGYSRPSVRWRDWEAVLNWNAEDPEASSITVAIDAASVDSGVDVFDGHLKGEDFFDVANYPDIVFISTKIERTGDDTGVMTGELTIKGITKSIMLDVKFNNGAFDERNNRYKIGFSAKTAVNRSDFDLDTYVPAVSDQVDVMIEAEFISPEQFAQ